MDVLNEQLLKFWDTLNKFDLRYLMVGGLATRFHGYNSCASCYGDSSIIKRHDKKVTLTCCSDRDFYSNHKEH